MPKPGDDHPKSSGSLKWWQWVLMYPTLFIALVGSAPTVLNLIRASQLDVPFRGVTEARAQQRLWEENFDCIKDADFSVVKMYNNTEVGAIVCTSGDVLIQVLEPIGTPKLRWIDFESIGAAVASPDGPVIFMPVSFGLEFRVQQTGPTVICTYWEGSYLVRRMRDGNRCFEYVINTATGAVIEVRDALCVGC